MNKIFNRAKEQEFLKHIINAPIHRSSYFLVGPPSSGKTALLKNILAEDNDSLKFVVNCRKIERLDAKKAFIREVEGLKHRFKSLLGYACTAVSYGMLTPDFTQSMMPPLEQLSKLILEAATKKKVVLFIDEVNVLRPELDANGLPPHHH